MTEQDEKDLELGRAVRELAKRWPGGIAIDPDPYGGFDIGGVRAIENPIWTGDTLDAAVSAAMKGVRG